MGAATAGSIKGINRVTMTVADVDRSTAFYTATTPLESLGAGMLRAPNGYLELVAGPDAVGSDAVVPVEGPGFTHVCFQSPAEDALYRTLVHAGATEVSRDGPVDLKADPPPPMIRQSEHHELDRAVLRSRAIGTGFVRYRALHLARKRGGRPASQSLFVVQVQ